MTAYGGFIKIHRKLIEWEWYKDNVVKSVFIHLLLKASFKDARWQGESIFSGQVITSSEKLGDELGFSRQQIRTALKKLQSTGEITIKTTNRYSKITIAKWEDYQTYDKLAGNLQETIKKPHLNKGYKENNVKEIYGTYQNVFLKKEEYESLLKDYPDTDKAIQYLSEYIEYKDYKVKSHYLALKKWVFDAIKDKPVLPRGGFHNYVSEATYDFEEIERRAIKQRMEGML